MTIYLGYKGLPLRLETKLIRFKNILDTQKCKVALPDRIIISERLYILVRCFLEGLVFHYINKEYYHKTIWFEDNHIKWQKKILKASKQCGFYSYYPMSNIIPAKVQNLVQILNYSITSQKNLTTQAVITFRADLLFHHIDQLGKIQNNGGE